MDAFPAVMDIDEKDRAATFEAHRPKLFAVAYRMLGSVEDAEDAVQEAFLRWSRAELTGLRAPEAYLTTTVTRLCIDHLRAARAQRETYVGPWLPEPLVTGADAAQAAEQADSLSMAFLLLLETLSPVERAVFLLHEVFDYGYDEIAEVVGKSAVNCRQIGRRARAHLRARRPRFDPSREARDRLLQQFDRACRAGDLDGLLATLADDVTLYSDGGGKVRAALKPIYGADKVARFLLGVLRKTPPGYEVRFALVNGQPGFVTYVDGVPQSASSLQICDGRIQNIYVVVNPEKLHGV